VDYDVFLCHASEDKPTVVVPLVLALERRGLSVWLDKMIMQIGDSITGKIDEGLANSRFGVVIVSPAFLGKNWPKRELDALAARETEANEVVILPVWHRITYDEVAAYSPTLASKLAARTSIGIEAVAEQIEIRCKRSSVAPSSPKQPTESRREQASEITNEAYEQVEREKAEEQARLRRETQLRRNASRVARALQDHGVTPTELWPGTSSGGLLRPER
jgi:hypothetical protein